MHGLSMKTLLRADSKNPLRFTTAGWMTRWAVATLLFVLSLAPAHAAGGNYEPTGPAAHARFGATMTLLQNGKVLLAGEGTAELYDPTTGTWSATGNPVVGRQYPTATLLPNGKVLVAGGIGSGNIVLNSTELYDPGTGTWSASGAMTSPRYVATAVLLANAKVLIAGGTSTSDASGSGALNSAELYDPATGTVTPTGSFVGNRFFAAATLLDNGMVLMTGGANATGTPVSTSNLYNPATGAWSPTGSMANTRVYAPVVKLPGGKVLTAGGLTSGSPISAEVYNPATGIWSPAANMLVGVSQHSMVLLPNGLVLAAGDTLLASQVYDPVSNVWQASGSPSTAHDSLQTANAILLRDGDVLFGPRDGGVASELYEPAPGTDRETLAREMISSYYLGILARPPEAGAVDSWYQGYFIYGVTSNIDVRFVAREMARIFFQSAEYQSRARSREQFIRDAYSTFLHRVPSQSELDGWLSGTWNRPQVVSLFAESAEFNQYIQGVFPGLAGAPTGNFVTTMYIGLLDRLVDAGGLAFWKGVLDSAFAAGGIEAVRNESRRLGSGVLASPEYLSTNPTNETHVVHLYRAFLGRYPGTSEIDYWTGQLNAGALTTTDLINQFAASAEFTSRLQGSFGPL